MTEEGGERQRAPETPAQHRDLSASPAPSRAGKTGCTGLENGERNRSQREEVGEGRREGRGKGYREQSKEVGQEGVCQLCLICLF